MRKINYDLYTNGILMNTTTNFDEATNWVTIKGNSYKTRLEDIITEMSDKEKEERKARILKREARRLAALG